MLRGLALLSMANAMPVVITQHFILDLLHGYRFQFLTNDGVFDMTMPDIHRDIHVIRNNDDAATVSLTSNSLVIHQPRWGLDPIPVRYYVSGSSATAQTFAFELKPIIGFSAQVDFDEYRISLNDILFEFNKTCVVDGVAASVHMHVHDHMVYFTFPPYQTTLEYNQYIVSNKVPFLFTIFR